MLNHLTYINLVGQFSVLLAGNHCWRFITLTQLPMIMRLDFKLVSS